jgi:hypothetical protein
MDGLLPFSEGAVSSQKGIVRFGAFGLELDLFARAAFVSEKSF